MRYDDFKVFLPKKILDAHVHILHKESWKDGYVFKPDDYKMIFNLHFGVPEYMEQMSQLLPQQEMSVNVFGCPEVGIDLADADAFTGSFVDEERVFGMALVSPRDSAEALLARMRSGRLIGYKPYQSFASYNKPLKEVELFDMMTPEQLEMANHYGWATTVHIPRQERLADELNLKQMEAWVKRYPNVKFIFAHLGRSYFLNCIKGRLERFADYGNCYFDTAMVNNDRVLEYAFRHFPVSRLVFGTDSPIALLPGKSVEINDQYVYMMGRANCHIGTSLDASASGLAFTSFYYEQLNGIMVAAEYAGLDATQVEAFFYGNAYKLFKEASKWLN